jgi:hypothetical protein
MAWPRSSALEFMRSDAEPFTFSHLSALADKDRDIHAIQIIKSASAS